GHLGVTTKQVCRWIERRASTNCPRPGPDGLYALADWEAWHANWHKPRVIADDPERGGPAAVGRRLGVSVNQVFMWIKRQAMTGCPRPGEDGLYSLTEWEAWHAEWVQRPSVTAARGRTRAA